jgi:hypothetical protein
VRRIAVFSLIAIPGASLAKRREHSDFATAAIHRDENSH